MTPHSATQRADSSSSVYRLSKANRSRSDDAKYCGRLNRIVCELHDSAYLEDVIPGRVEFALRSLLGVDRLTLYLRSRKHHSLVGRYQSGDRIGERHIYFGSGSVVGYVAMTRGPTLVRDVHSLDALREIHPHLRFDPSQDREFGFRTRAVCVVPVISKGVLLGVLEVANPAHGGEFLMSELARVQEVARFLGQKLRYDFRATCTPFEFLVKTRQIESETLARLNRVHQSRTPEIAGSLLHEVGLAANLIGTSMERYYQVPFLPYDPSLAPLPRLGESIGIEELGRRGMVPLQGDSGRTIVVAEDPNDTPRILDLQQALHLQQYDLRVALREDVVRYLSRAPS